MPKNRILRPRTLSDIDQRIERVLRGLGNPEPPLQLSQVRELLKLDRAFYTADAPSVLRETVSRLRVAGIQVLKRPTLLFEAVRKFDLRALYIPDHRRILLDRSPTSPQASLERSPRDRTQPSPLARGGHVRG